VQCCQGLDAADANEVAAVIEAPSDGAGKIYSPWSISGRQIGSVAQGLIDVPPARAKNSSAQEVETLLIFSVRHAPGNA